MQQASELKNVQKKRGCARAALGALSEAATVFDPERLVGIIGELSDRLPRSPHAAGARDYKWKDLAGTPTLVEATLITAMPRIRLASVRSRRGESGTVKWRRHTHFEVDRHVPSRIDVTPNGGGDHDERAVLNRTLEPDRLYVMERGDAKFKLFNDIAAVGSSYVCRLRDNSVCLCEEDRPLTDADRAENVVSDQIVKFGQPTNGATNPITHPLRLVIVKIKPHVSKCQYQGGSSGVASDGFLRIATNLLEVPAEISAILSAHRWTIEIFFRQFKHLLGCRHLLSHNQNGIEIQTDCAIIACQLIALWTGRQPTKRTHEMLCYVIPSRNSTPTWRNSNAPTNRPRKKSDRPRRSIATPQSESLHAAHSPTRSPASHPPDHRSAPLKPPSNPTDSDSNTPDRYHRQPKQYECRTVLLLTPFHSLDRTTTLPERNSPRPACHFDEIAGMLLKDVHSPNPRQRYFARP